MAKAVATDWKVMVNNVNLSSWAFAVDGVDEKEQIDISGFSPTGAREYAPGTRDQTVTISFVNDRASGGPHQTIEPLYRGGSVFPFYVVPDSDLGTSASNPLFGGTASVYGFPFGAELNNREELEIAFRPAQNSVFNWGTAVPPP